MAIRPLAFGVRLRDQGRTVQVRARERDPQRYVVEVRRAGRRTERREHASLPGALRDLARSWRERLH
jgi:hypothetical protein